ncbi:hypothetical protein C1H46_026057 [Malus baccata]|uniref:Uncharacterized protein n=1 Tax=Malus baccata TaxID=106549 RepID=A0A540LPS4_MALBA|nr:hypothetical protein C1H46_026057 [Malus baccata]
MASKKATANPKSHTSIRTCSCSPTTHPGSFRCSLHRNSHKQVIICNDPAIVEKSGTIKGCLLLQINPSEHDPRRRRKFQARPTRFLLANE